MFRAIIILIFVLSFSVSHAGDFWHDLGKTFTQAFDQEGLVILAVGAGVTAIAASQDQAMYDAWVNHQRMSTDISKIGDAWGTGYVEIGIAAGQLIWDRENGLAHTNALISATAVSFALKYSVARARPDSDTKTSFPSGHTQFSFATAESMNRSYGLKLGIPFYGMATLTGLSRLADKAHWFSDVTAGATIGILFGRSASKRNIVISPMNVSRGGGVQITYHF